MSNSIRRRRPSFVALLAVVAVGSLAPAGASAAPSAAHCDVRLDRLEAQFHDMAERRGYEEASEWWQARWQAYHQSCVMT